MQSFPHQISDLDKLYRALAVVGNLIADDKDVSDDETLGVALARAGVYTFRGTLSLEEALQNEKEKKRANRGTETAARDLRRLFSLMNLIDKSESASRYVLTEAGRQLLVSTAGTDRHDQWRNAMLSMTLETGVGTYSHPYRILTRLVSAAPGIEKQKLMLALEPVDDSDAEFDRIANLAKRSFPDIVNALGVSESNAANSIKILPSIAQQLGDIVDKSGKSFPAPVTVVTEEGTVTAPKEVGAAQKVLAQVTPESIAENPEFTEGATVTVDLTSAIALRKKRTLDHNKAVKSLASVLHAAEFKLYEFPFDCLAIGEGNRVILAEVKTLDGSPADERQQSERALGQLKGYCYFSLGDEHKEGVVVELAAFTMKPTEQTIAFLRQAGVETIWLENGKWKFLNDQGSGVAFEIGLLF